MCLCSLTRLATAPVGRHKCPTLGLSTTMFVTLRAATTSATALSPAVLTAVCRHHLWLIRWRSCLGGSYFPTTKASGARVVNMESLSKSLPQETLLTNKAFRQQVRHKNRSSRNSRLSVVNKYLKIEERKAKLANRKTLEVWSSMTLRDLAKSVDLSTDQVFELILDVEEANLIHHEREPIKEPKVFAALAKKLNRRLRFVADPRRLDADEEKEEENLDVKVIPPRPEDLQPRPPVVAIMGHVDHGKTTLLDYLRHSRIVEGEFGGITQHIGAFSVELSGGRKVTFVDTPGHAAFKAMRYRGALATDIVVLVVATSEGVLEQTIESIKMIKESGTSLVVALNKIDLPDANVEGTKAELRDSGVQLEDFGGDVQSVAISALKGTNVEALVEALVVQADVLQLSADYDGDVEGLVIESTVDSRLGKTATVLIKRGTMKKGQILVSGQTHGKVRKMLDDRGKEVFDATPSMAVKVMGWKELPSAGDAVNEVQDERRAQTVITWRKKQDAKLKEAALIEELDKQRSRERSEYLELRRKKLEAGFFKPRYGKHDFFIRKKESEEYGGPPKMSVILKADVDGSLEAILNCLDSYNEEDVVLDIVEFAVGEINENDFMLAQQFDAVIYAFNTKVPQAMLKKAAGVGVKIKDFNIIYKLIDDLKDEISKKLPLLEVDEVTGKAQVQQEFLINVGNKKIPVAGCRVQAGKLQRGDQVKLLRGDQVVCVGTVSTLKHLKADVNEVEKGKECGIMLNDPTVRFLEGDVIQPFLVKTEEQYTQWSPGF